MLYIYIYWNHATSEKPPALLNLNLANTSTIHMAKTRAKARWCNTSCTWSSSSSWITCSQPSSSSTNNNLACLKRPPPINTPKTIDLETHLNANENWSQCATKFLLKIHESHITTSLHFMATPHWQPQVPWRPAATLRAQQLAIADKSLGGAPTDMKSREECHETPLVLAFYPCAKLQVTCLGSIS